MSNDLEEAARLENEIDTARPRLRHILDHLLPVLKVKRRALYQKGADQQAEALSSRIEKLERTARSIDDALRNAVDRMCALRNRYHASQRRDPPPVIPRKRDSDRKP